MAESYPLQWPDGWPEKAAGASYMVTADGSVLSLRFGTWRALAQYPDEDGYPCVLLRLAIGRRKRITVHRAVCEAFHGRKPTGLEVLHRNGNQLDNSETNLRWGTQAENAADREAHGRTARGLRNGAYTCPDRVRRGRDNGNSRLTEEQVLDILRDPRPQTAIAADNDVNQTLVSAIKLGRIWNHVTGLPPYARRSKYG